MTEENYKFGVLKAGLMRVSRTAIAAANVVAEQFGEAHHKCQFYMHITVVPRLMTG
jgi:hypothetical protein